MDIIEKIIISLDQKIQPEIRDSIYFNLIFQLMNCPNGQEFDILNQNQEIIDSLLVNTMNNLS